MTVNLITGATGFLGSRLIGRVAGDVHVLVRPSSDTTQIEQMEHLRIWSSDGDANDLARIFESVQPTRVYHLASHYQRSDKPTAIPAMVHANIEFGTSLLHALSETGDATFVYAGSFFEHYRDADEALNLYAATKRAFSEIVAYYEEAYDLNACKVTMYEVYGQGDPRTRFVNTVAAALVSGSVVDLPVGDPQLDLVHVDDAADALVAAATAVERDRSNNREFSATSGTLTSLTEIVDIVSTISGRPVLTEIGSYPTPKRTIERPWTTSTPPEWTPRISLVDGLTSVLAWYADAR